MLIQETQDRGGTHYRLWADIVPCNHPQDLYNLLFYSTWSNAKQPEVPQIKAQFILDRDAVNNLRELLENK